LAGVVDREWVASVWIRSGGGGKRMVLEASPAGAPLYEREGFKTEGRLMVFVPEN